MDSSRVAVVRAAIDCFNREDIPGVLELCDDDIELPDVINGIVVKGKPAVEGYWQRQFQVVDHSVMPGEIVEMGDAVIVVAYHQMYEPDAGPLGAGVTAVHRYTFRDERIAKMEFTGLDEIPASVRERLG